MGPDEVVAWFLLPRVAAHEDAEPHGPVGAAEVVLLAQTNVPEDEESGD